MLAEQTNTVEDWVNFLGKEHMPAMAVTVQKLNKLTSDDDSRVSQLTEQILKDPSLTSRLLQVVNSAIYKGYGGNIKTVTRAIVMMGFDTIRDTSMSMQILDKILKHQPSQHLMLQIANSFHGAMQARGMLSGSKVDAREEIFISTLLLHFAELSLLSRDDEISRKLNKALSEEHGLAKEAVRQVLGCGFNEISLALAKQWELGDLLIEALSRPSVPTKPAQAVLLGDELSRVATLGWDSKQVIDVVEKIAEFRGIDPKVAMAEVKQVADLAQDMATDYGAAKVRHLIPSSEARMQDQSESVSVPVDVTDTEPQDIVVSAEESVEEKTEFTSTSDKVIMPEDEGIEDLMELALSGQTTSYDLAPKPHDSNRHVASDVTPVANNMVGGNVGNVQLQMDIMAKLNQLIAEKRMDVNSMLNLVLEGMCDAIGLDRVVMGLVSRDRKKWIPKFFKGKVDLEFKERLVIELEEENAFSLSILQSQQLWMGSRMMAGRAYLHTANLQKALICKEYFVSPIIVARKPIGAFYGDCGISHTPLNDQQYAGFSMLAQQAGMALTAVQS